MSQFLDHFAEDPDPDPLQSERSDTDPTTGSGAVLSLPAWQSLRLVPDTLMYSPFTHCKSNSEKINRTLYSKFHNENDSKTFKKYNFWFSPQSTYMPRVPQCLSPSPNRDPPPLLPQASVSPPRNQRGRGHTRLRVRGWGPNSDDWKQSLVLCQLCSFPPTLFYLLGYQSIYPNALMQNYHRHKRCTRLSINHEKFQIRYG